MESAHTPVQHKIVGGELVNEHVERKLVNFGAIIPYLNIREGSVKLELFCFAEFPILLFVCSSM